MADGLSAASAATTTLSISSSLAPSSLPRSREGDCGHRGDDQGAGRVSDGRSREGEHDDLVVATALACWRARFENGSAGSSRTSRLWALPHSRRPPRKPWEIWRAYRFEASTPKYSDLTRVVAHRLGP